MCLINQFNYYRKYSPSYIQRINKIVETILNSSENKQNFYFDEDTFQELVNNILSSLNRITNKLISSNPITPKEIINQSDDLTIIKTQISDTILEKIEKKDYKITLTDGYFKFTKF